MQERRKFGDSHTEHAADELPESSFGGRLQEEQRAILQPRPHFPLLL